MNFSDDITTLTLFFTTFISLSIIGSISLCLYECCKIACKTPTEHAVITVPIPDVIKTQLYDDVCPICIDTFRYNDSIVILTCNHVYHKNCITSWVNNPTEENIHLCPKCKAPITLIGNQVPVSSIQVPPTPHCI